MGARKARQNGQGSGTASRTEVSGLGQSIGEESLMRRDCENEAGHVPRSVARKVRVAMEVTGDEHGLAWLKMLRRKG